MSPAVSRQADADGLYQETHQARPWPARSQWREDRHHLCREHSKHPSRAVSSGLCSSSPAWLDGWLLGGSANHLFFRARSKRAIPVLL